MLILSMLLGAFRPPKPYKQDLLQYALDGHGYIFSCAVIIFHPQGPLRSLPDARMEYKVVRRQAGLGSLGQERFVAIAKWQGGWIAREAKLTIPSSCSWLNDQIEHRQSWYERAISSAVRSPDPFQRIDGSWLIRRLSPDSNPIDIQTLPKHSDEAVLLYSMGSEAANVHLGTKGDAKRIVNDLKRRKARWLQDAAVRMAKILEKDWNRYRKN